MFSSKQKQKKCLFLSLSAKMPNNVSNLGGGMHKRKQVAGRRRAVGVSVLNEEGFQALFLFGSREAPEKQKKVCLFGASGRGGVLAQTVMGTVCHSRIWFEAVHRRFHAKPKLKKARQGRKG